MTLRVAVVHSFYSSLQPSGENTQVETEVDALTRAGADVALFAAKTDDLEKRALYRARCAVRVASGRGASPFDDIEAWGPDVVHVHNLFPNFGRTWVAALSAPVVTTLHNFRFTCANGALVRDGRQCTDCPDGDRLSAVRHRCYRGSLSATIPVAISQMRGPARDPLLARADRILCLSGRQRRLLVEGGVPDGRLVDWSNFLPDRLDPERSRGRVRVADRRGGLYVGRLSEEKGVLEMIEAWRGPDTLRVVGDGPLMDQVRRAAVGRPVEILGRRGRAEVIDLMACSTAMVMPGAFPELAPLTFMEALASWLPVVVRTTSDLSPRVRADGLGAVVDSYDEVPDAAAALAGRPELGGRCRSVFEADFTEHAWSRRITDLYAGLRTSRPRGEPHPDERTFRA